MDESTTNSEVKKGGNLSQQAIYGKVSARSQEILKVLFDMLIDPNRNLRFAAAKTLLNKIVPDLKAMELTGKDGEPIQLTVISGADFLAWQQKAASSPNNSALSDAATIQDASVAQAGTKNINSDSPTGKVESA